jgi:LuxR family transcriptional regulator of csgAB operon
MLGGCGINIIGPNALQNALLTAFIEKETEAVCNSINSSQLNNFSIISPTRSSLTLIDSHGEDADKALQVLAKCIESGSVDQNVAFFNVDKNSLLESAVAPPEVRGLFFSDTSKENFVKGIFTICHGELWYPRKVMSNFLMNGLNSDKYYKEFTSQNNLTRREIQILNMLTTGAKNIEIAQNLCVSVHTIKTHVYHIYKKIDVSNRMEAVQWAYNNL